MATAVERRRARAASFGLAGGYRLLVGRDIEDRLQIQALIKQALGWGLGADAAARASPAAS